MTSRKMGRAALSPLVSRPRRLQATALLLGVDIPDTLLPSLAPQVEAVHLAMERVRALDLRDVEPAPVFRLSPSPASPHQPHS